MNYEHKFLKYKNKYIKFNTENLRNELKYANNIKKRL